MMADHPLIGIGPGAFKSQVVAYQTGADAYEYLAHNTYLELGAELGIPFTLLFVAMLVATFLSLEETRRMAMKRRRFVADVALGLQAGLIGCSVGIFFLTATHQKCMWLLVFLSIPLRALAQRARHGAMALGPSRPRATVPLALREAGSTNAG
jgi:O-antigen ligase